MSDTNNTTKGGQIFLNNMRMFIQIQGWVMKVGILLSIILAAIFCYFNVDMDTLTLGWAFIKFNILNLVEPHSDTRFTTLAFNGELYRNTVFNFAHNAHLEQAYKAAKLEFLYGLVISVIIVGVIMSLILRWFNAHGRTRTEDQFLRGTVVRSPKEVGQFLKQKKILSPFEIDKLRFLKNNFELQHVLFDGSTGTGKSQGLRRVIAFIRSRGDKAIVYDKGCNFIGEFYDSNSDVILNPFDERSCDWDVWCDGADETDYENIAEALIPQSGEADPFWVEAARTIFASTAYKMKLDTNIERTTTKLLELMLTSELDFLAEYLKGTESATLISEKAAKLAISIKAILASNVKSLRFLDGLSNPDDSGEKRRKLSIKEWVQDENEKGFLFLSSNAEQHVSLRPLISAWLSIASTSLLGLTPDSKRRIWVVMDEMPTLHKLPELAGTISEVRKFGGCYVIGIQSYAQLEHSYGEKTASVIFDLLNTRFYYRSPSEKMARVSSADLGETEFIENREQYSFGAAQVRDGVSLGGSRNKQAAVTATEITQLNDLEFWLKNAGRIPICKYQMKYEQPASRNPFFIKRELPNTKRSRQLDELIAWSQLVPLNSASNADKQRIIATYDAQMAEDPEAVRKGKMSKLATEAQRYQTAKEQDTHQTVQENVEPANVVDLSDDFDDEDLRL